MLNSKTTETWVRNLAAFINCDLSGAELASCLNILELPFQQRGAKHLAALRARAEETVRWMITQEIDDPIRRGIADDWLAHSDVITSSDWNHVPLDAAIDFDIDGRVVLNDPHVRSPDAFCALTIAELASPDCPVQIRQCALTTCNRLFVRPLVKVGRPQEACSPAHAATLRTHRYREKHFTGPKPRRHK